MKQIMILLLSLTINSLSYAQTPAQQSDTENAQVTVTHDSVQQVLSALQNSISNATHDSFSHPDFEAKSKDFNEKVEQAMAQFESTLKDDILKEAATEIDHLMAIKQSPAYTPEQRDLLLTQQTQVAGTVFQQLSEKYAKALRQLYAPVLPEAKIQLLNKSQWKARDVDFYSASYKITFLTQGFDSYNIFANNHYLGGNYGMGYAIETVSHGKRSQKYIDTKEMEYRDFGGARLTLVMGNLGSLNDFGFYDLEPINFPQLKSQLFSSEVAQGCYSSSCVLLYSNALSSYLKLVHDSLDRALVLSPQDFPMLILNPENMNVANAAGYISTNGHDVSALPFDISPQDYQQQLAKKH